MSDTISGDVMLTLLVSEEQFIECNGNLQMSDKSSGNPMLKRLMSDNISGNTVLTLVKSDKNSGNAMLTLITADKS